MKLESLKSSKFEALSESGMALIKGGANEWEPTKGGSFQTGATKTVNGITYHQVHLYKSDEMSCTSMQDCDYRYYGESDIWV